MQTKIVGLTGGIGSGKTTVANMFREFGVPVYIADVEAKKLMQSSKVVKRKLIALFGDKAYSNGDLNKPFISSKIFNDQSFLDRMNAIIHPKVAQHFKRWLKQQTSAYIIKEAAIIFEHHMQSQYDYIIIVTANRDERIRRILNRDNTTKEKVTTIMKHQLADEEKIKLSDFVIVNDDLDHTKDQVLKVHHTLLNKINNSKF